MIYYCTYYVLHHTRGMQGKASSNLIASWSGLCEQLKKASRCTLKHVNMENVTEL